MSSSNSSNNKTKVVHYSQNNFSSRAMEVGFIFFEIIGQTILYTYDITIAIPELCNRQIRRKNGIFFKVTQGYLKWRYPDLYKNNITIVSGSGNDDLSEFINDPYFSNNSTNSNNSINNNFLTTTTTTTTTTTIINDSLYTNNGNGSASNLAPTMINTNNLSKQLSPQKSSEKVVLLENELTRIREEFARLMASQQQQPSVINNPTTKSSPVPPPPPPPPPVFNSNNSSILKRVKASSEPNTPSPTTPVKLLSIGDALRAGNKVALKKSDVARSPGGTPIRDVTNKSSNPISTQDFIALALKKKFQNVNINQESPELKKNYKKKISNNDSFFSDSDDDFQDNQENQKPITQYI